MTEHTTAGTADLMERATIELVHNRRLQALNEVDQAGWGTKVNAKYWMQIFDQTRASSLQREKQLDVNQPLQYFFLFEFTEPSDEEKARIFREVKQYSSIVDNQMDKFYTVNHHAFPLAKGKVLVRLENIADHFDVINVFEKNGFGEAFFINMNTFATDLYLESNPDTDPAKVPPFTVKELSLSGALVQKDLEKYQLDNKWKGDDDSTLSKLQKPEDHPDGIALEPQRIRTFEI